MRRNLCVVITQALLIISGFLVSVLVDECGEYYVLVQLLHLFLSHLCWLRHLLQRTCLPHPVSVK